MGEPAIKTSLEDYLALDLASDGKLEYLNGVVVAMAGASPRHNQIAANVLGELRVALSGSPCRVLGSDQRVRVSQTGAYLYPDVTVTCAEPRFADDRPASLLNPRLVVEVLSSSTSDHDRGVKLAHYRRLESVHEVVLVEQSERRAEIYRRLEDGRWLIIDVLEGELDLTSVGARLSLDQVYAQLDGLPIDEA